MNSIPNYSPALGFIEITMQMIFRSVSAITGLGSPVMAISLSKGTTEKPDVEKIVTGGGIG